MKIMMVVMAMVMIKCSGLEKKKEKNEVKVISIVWQNLLRNRAHVHLSMSQQTSDSVHKFPTT